MHCPIHLASIVVCLQHRALKLLSSCRLKRSPKVRLCTFADLHFAAAVALALACRSSAPSCTSSSSASPAVTSPSANQPAQSCYQPRWARVSENSAPCPADAKPCDDITSSYSSSGSSSTKKAEQHSQQQGAAKQQVPGVWQRDFPVALDLRTAGCTAQGPGDVPSVSSTVPCKAAAATAGGGLIKAHRPPTLMEDMAAAVASFADQPIAAIAGSTMVLNTAGPSDPSLPAHQNRCTTGGVNGGCLPATAGADTADILLGGGGPERLRKSCGTRISSSMSGSGSDSDSSLEDWRTFRQRVKQAPGKFL